MPDTLAIPVRTTRYQCPHCRRTRAHRAAAEAHIARCWQNPEARGCKTCAHYEAPETGPHPEHPGFPEICSVGREISGGLCVGCPLWAAAEDGER